MLARDGKHIASPEQLQEAVTKMSVGQFDIDLPDLSAHRIIYKSYFARVIKYFNTCISIFSLIRIKPGSNLECFLNPNWQIEYIRKLNTYFTMRGISFAYLELAEVVFKNSDQLEKLLISVILNSFFKVILQDAYRPSLFEQYKQALLLRNNANELRKEDIISNIINLKGFLQYQYLKVPAYKNLKTNPLERIFEVNLPSYEEATSALPKQQYKFGFP